MIMGHSFPDMDAFGAAVGVSSITRALGIDAYIVLDENRNFAAPLSICFEPTAGTAR